MSSLAWEQGLCLGPPPRTWREPWAGLLLEAELRRTLEKVGPKWRSHKCSQEDSRPVNKPRPCPQGTCPAEKRAGLCQR